MATNRAAFVAVVCVAHVATAAVRAAHLYHVTSHLHARTPLLNLGKQYNHSVRIEPCRRRREQNSWAHIFDVRPTHQPSIGAFVTMPHVGIHGNQSPPVRQKTEFGDAAQPSEKLQRMQLTRILKRWRIATVHSTSIHGAWPAGGQVTTGSALYEPTGDMNKNDVSSSIAPLRQPTCQDPKVYQSVLPSLLRKGSGEAGGRGISRQTSLEEKDANKSQRPLASLLTYPCHFEFRVVIQMSEFEEFRLAFAANGNSCGSGGGAISNAPRTMHVQDTSSASTNDVKASILPLSLLTTFSPATAHELARLTVEAVTGHPATAVVNRRTVSTIRGRLQQHRKHYFLTSLAL
eukprot:GHVT01012572.1.p1 GENE.GHVT01012572.1~~GHVT01012572.1.p1  ORF type:complete len:347 (+),score=14.54 GHVT01012572.1:354-1394(+)